MSEDHGIIAKAGKREKLENPARIKELDPMGTLKKIGFQAGETLCDIGAGSGLFSLAAASMSARYVWALDTDEDILADLQQRSAGMTNLQTITVNGFHYPLLDHSADWVLLVTVLHEIAEKKELFAEIRRIIAADGNICLIEFRGERTPMGPSPEYRIGAETAEKIFNDEGFVKTAEFLLGDNLYAQTYHPR